MNLHTIFVLAGVYWGVCALIIFIFATILP
jgi:hypothetical protein